MRDFQSVRRIVIKAGTNLLSSESGIDSERVRMIVDQIAMLRDMGYQVMLVGRHVLFTGNAVRVRVRRTWRALVTSTMAFSRGN